MVSAVICDLYNSSMKEGYLPVALKESIVHPVPKCSPAKSGEDDLRLITLTSLLAKVLEGLSLASLLNQVEHKLDHKQFSVSGKSTVHALTHFLHTTLDYLDRGNNYVRVSLLTFLRILTLSTTACLLGTLRYWTRRP